MKHFQGTEYRSHTSCISEAQKYQGALYKEKKKGPQQKQVTVVETAVVPRKAYVEDEATVSTTVAVVDVPPKAPSPPPAAETVNVFDFLVTEETPKTNGHTQELQRYTNPDGQDPHYVANGYAYGDAPLQPSLERYDSYASLPGTNGALVTPAPRRGKESARSSEKKSDKKRKRHHPEDLDISRAKQQDTEMADAPPVLHSGLTGGLNRMLSTEDYDEEAAGSPGSPIKRSKKERSEKRRVSEGTHKSSSSHKDEDDKDRGRHHHRRHRRHHEDSSDDERRHSRKVKAIEYPEDRKDGQIVTYRSPAELFMSFVAVKGPESERGQSINKALKRYHREMEVRGERGRQRDEGDKELWKSLRVKVNERGEVVLFV